MNRRLRIILTITAVVIIALLTGMFSLNSAQNQRIEDVKRTAEEFVKKYDPDSSFSLQYQGLVSDSNDIHTGEAEFSYGPYSLYYKVKENTPCMIYQDVENGALITAYSDVEEIKNHAFKMLTAAIGEKRSVLCEVETEQYPAYHRS